MFNSDNLQQSIINGNANIAIELTKNELANKTNAITLINEALIPAMNKVSNLYFDSKYFLSDIILSANACNNCLDYITSFHCDSVSAIKGIVLIGVVYGDMHDLGKNILATIFRLNNFDVIDIGVDVSIQTFIRKVREVKPNILAIGANMSSSVMQLKQIIDALMAKGLRNDLKIIVGGTCVTGKIAALVGADIWGKDALYTMELVKELIYR